MHPGLFFDDAAHRYYLSGVWLPGVTSVLEGAGLIDYSFLGDRREQYLARGRAVHMASHADDIGELDEQCLTAEILGYLEAWRAFRRDYGFVPSLIEHRVCNPAYRYAGTLDRVGKLRDGTEIILDLKTGVAPAAVRYQLAAYAACLPHPRTRLRRCVELHADASYRVIGFQTAEYAHDFETFAAALRGVREETIDDYRARRHAAEGADLHRGRSGQGA